MLKTYALGELSPHGRNNVPAATLIVLVWPVTPCWVAGGYDSRSLTWYVPPRGYHTPTRQHGVTGQTAPADNFTAVRISTFRIFLQQIYCLRKSLRPSSSTIFLNLFIYFSWFRLHFWIIIFLAGGRLCGNLWRGLFVQTTVNCMRMINTFNAPTYVNKQTLGLLRDKTESINSQGG
jgi:hypothetical protein